MFFNYDNLSNELNFGNTMKKTKKKQVVKNLQEVIIASLKKDNALFLPLKEYTTVRRRPIKLKNSYVYKVRATKKSHRFYNKDTGEVRIFKPYDDNDTWKTRIDERYMRYSFSNFYKIKRLSNTSFKLFDKKHWNPESDDNLSIFFIKLNELGLKNFDMSFHSINNLNDEYHRTFSDEYYKIKFTDPADAALFIFTAQSTKEKDDAYYY